MHSIRKANVYPAILPNCIEYRVVYDINDHWVDFRLLVRIGEKIIYEGERSQMLSQFVLEITNPLTATEIKSIFSFVGLDVFFNVKQNRNDYLNVRTEVPA